MAFQIGPLGNSHKQLLIEISVQAKYRKKVLGVHVLLISVSYQYNMIFT